MRDADILLDEVLRPSPPMSPRTLFVILVLVGIINFAFGMSFMLRGAWPITPFMGADVALLAWAFRAVRRAARREEHVTLTPSELKVVHTSERGAVREFALNPYWVRLEVDDPPQPGGALTLWSHGKGFRIGAFLAPGERARFAAALKNALWAARAAR